MNTRDAWILECKIATYYEDTSFAPTLSYVVNHNLDWFSNPRRTESESMGWYYFSLDADGGPYQYRLEPRFFEAKYAKGFKRHEHH